MTSGLTWEQQQDYQEQISQEVVRRYRANYVDWRNRMLSAGADGATLLGDPKYLGEHVLQVIDAKQDFEQRALADTYLSPKAREAISAALAEEAHATLTALNGRVMAKSNAAGRALRPAEPSQNGHAARLERQIELQRAEGRLQMLGERGLSPADLIDQSDGPMLDAIEASPEVWLPALPERQAQELIAARRREIATPAERANLEKIALLNRTERRVIALFAAAGDGRRLRASTAACGRPMCGACPASPRWRASWRFFDELLPTGAGCLSPSGFCSREGQA
jgi:hypothetical protein